MAKQTNSHSSNRRYDWKEPGTLSFSEFNLLMRQQITAVLQNQEQVERAYTLVNSRSAIDCDERDYLLESLHGISASICTFYAIFEEPTKLPSAVRPLYYPLVARLFASERLIKRSIQTIRSFCSPGQIASNAVIRQHYSIIHSLEELLEACKEIKLCTQNMLDQARFQMPRQV